MKKILIPMLILGIHVLAWGQQTSDHGRFGALLWKYQTEGKIFSSPLLYYDLLLFGSEDGHLYALHATTGTLAWKFKTDGSVNGSPAVRDNKVFFTSYDGNFYAVDVTSGRLLWKFSTRGEKRAGAKGLWTMKPVTEYMDDPFDFFLSSPVTDSSTGVVYFGSGDGNLYALSMTDGKLQWHFSSGGIIHTSPVLANNTLYFGSWDRYLYALDSRTGKEKWKFRTREDTAYHLLEGIQASPLVYEGHVFFGARDGYFYSLDTATGQLTWKYSANSSWILTTAAAKDDVIFTGTSDTYLLLALDAATGKEKFRTTANGYVYSSPLIDSNTIYFGDFTGQLLAVDRLSGAIIDRYETPGRVKHEDSTLNKGKLDFAYMTKGLDLAYYTTTVVGMHRLYRLGSIVSKPVIGNEIIYFGSADGALYAVRLNSSM
ncbi:MAG TPA: PQQ-binding-like beta-propeller repeat protein [Puia sp.]|nr:PQQ-binding-like beta-propeller repeat protein [Puia sp.]